jgi:crotonobetainyl-CoA:carnitine CoA-transferase CaiB-like acyl-CoA transferase
MTEPPIAATDGAPLAGPVAIELDHSVAAPFAARILAGLGANVMKVEEVEGDDALHWGRGSGKAQRRPSSRPPALGEHTLEFLQTKRSFHN